MYLIIGIIIVILIFLFLRKKKKQDENLFGKTNPEAEKYCLIIDTETTGLTKDRNLRATKANIDNFPGIVEIAWGVYSRKGEIISEGNYIIKQKKPIPTASIEIHGISEEQCLKDGVELNEALIHLKQDAKGCKRLVGHNIMFDKRVVEAECIREGLEKPFTGMTTYDTIKLAQQHYKTRKYFKLDELYEELYNEKVPEDIGRHRAISDVVVTSAIFFPLKLSGDTFDKNRK